MQETRYDVVGIGNAIVDIIGRCDDAFLSKHDLAKGFMRLIDAQRGRPALRAHGPGRSSAPAARPPTPSPGSPRSAARAPLSGASPTTSSARSFCARHPRHRASPSTRRAATERRTDRRLPHPRDARRRAHHEHLPRRQHRARTPARSTPADRAPRRSPTWRATCSTSRRPRRRFTPAAAIAAKAGRKTALTLSDAFCVDRHRADFRKLVQQRGRHPVRQREGDHRALRGEQLRGGGDGGARRMRDRGADTLRSRAR